MITSSDELGHERDTPERLAAFANYDIDIIFLESEVFTIHNLVIARWQVTHYRYRARCVYFVSKRVSVNEDAPCIIISCEMRPEYDFNIELDIGTALPNINDTYDQLSCKREQSTYEHNE